MCQVYNMRTSDIAGGVEGPVSPTHRFSPAKSYHEVLNGGLGQLQLVCSMLVVHPDAQSVVPPDLTLQLQETITPLNNISAARRQRVYHQERHTGSILPMSRLRKVDFPMPFGPTTATAEKYTH